MPKNIESLNDLTKENIDYFFIQFDGSCSTLDDFRFSGMAIALGSEVENLEIKTNDKFVLYDCALDAIVGHGTILSEIYEKDFQNSSTQLRLNCNIGRKKNFPLKISQLSELLGNKILASWKEKPLCRITESEFNKIFKVWWGIDNFATAR